MNHVLARWTHLERSRESFTATEPTAWTVNGSRRRAPVLRRVLLGVHGAFHPGVRCHTAGMSSSAWTVRQARPTDRHAVARHRYFKADDNPENCDCYADWLQTRIGQDVYVGRLAICADEVIGGAGCVILDWGPSRGSVSPLRARIVNVFTDPRWRRRGIALTLVSQVIGDCQLRGISNFSLGATKDAEGLYRGLGFVRQETEMMFQR